MNAGSDFDPVAGREALVRQVGPRNAGGTGGLRAADLLQGVSTH